MKWKRIRRSLLVAIAISGLAFAGASWFVGGALVAPANQLKPRLGVSPSQLRPIDHIQLCGCPVLVASGDCDVHTTLPETRRLYDAAREPKQLAIFEGVGHNDLRS